MSIPTVDAQSEFFKKRVNSFIIYLKARFNCMIPVEVADNLDEFERQVVDYMFATGMLVRRTVRVVTEYSTYDEEVYYLTKYNCEL